MDANKASKILLKQHPDMIATNCLDFEDFFLFNLVPYFYGSEPSYSGRTYYAVDKESGRVFEYDITTDPDAYLNSKEVEIRTVFDEKI